ncbi:MAG: hypothetical protein ACI8RE_002887, partial [Ilumatobacter sp.]
LRVVERIEAVRKSDGLPVGSDTPSGREY